MAAMDDYGNQLEDSNDPDHNDAVVPVIEMATGQSGSAADGTSTLNLELTMNVSANAGQGENLTEEPKPQQDGLLLLAVKLLEKIDARTVALEERMSALERPMYQTGKSVTEIQSTLANQWGSPTAAATISSAPAVVMASVGNLLTETNIPPQRQNRAAVSNDIGSLAETKKSLEKGKGLAPSNVMSSLYIIIPNSPGLDDDVIIDESLSTPRPTKGTNSSGVPKRTLAQYWSSGVAKRSTTSGTTTHDSVDGVCEKIFRDLPSMSTLDCTTKVCEMFSVQEACRIPLKVPKLEKIDSNHLTGEEQLDSRKMATPGRIARRMLMVLVPVCEPTYTWYLMVVDVKHGRVYSLDVTRAPEHTERRERKMRTILLVLSQIFKLECNMLSFSHVSSDPTTWGPIKYPDGVPSYPECNDSCLWILNWIQTEGKFKVSNLPWQ
ncbi:hypothetical protein S245_035042, partial [Arachis hypogaea]